MTGNAERDWKKSKAWSVGMNGHRSTIPAVQVLSARVHAASLEVALDTVVAWASSRESRYVCFGNVHMVASAQRNRELQQAMDAADLVLPDGSPVAWMMRRLGAKEQERVCGPDFMIGLCERAQGNGFPIFLFGSTEPTLLALERRLRQSFPRIEIAGTYSPPFHPLSAEENTAIVDRINRTEAPLLLVALGCPKQEIWMHRWKPQLNAVMLGVGAAFDFHAGTVRRAPPWMRRYGLEWLHRLCSEPRRLWRRYLVTNSIFAVKAGFQLLRHTIDGDSMRRS